ncbi:3-hydroxyacyl-CoA dehydrogenase NAD-binding domain-containing protein [Nocardia sp. NPDC005366]|uniref:3-hydroxyacyl-CoA dehydrogenase NAD-binding domain-containing protein n=1 Tax=Nocardia sp. NPDC005366 TaxID=3156878 RepID=UPI0033A6B83B
MTEPDGPVAVIGTGVIGAGWAALFLAAGREVVAHDPGVGAEERLRDDVARLWPSLARLGMADGGVPDRLTFTDDPAEAVSEAVFVQENGPERSDIKQRLFTTLDQAAAPNTVIASSSSGIAPSQLQAMCTRYPERVLVGHPFHPCHLIPLVEVVPGPGTSETAIDRAMTVYSSLGKRPIRIRQELPGHVVNRLQAALWQEAYSLVERGVASVADIDAAISYGPGLRWALLGPLVNQHLSGGPGGLAHVLEHLGPPTEQWMRDLRPARLSPALVEQLVSGVDEELSGIDPNELVAQRDELLIQLLEAKRGRTALP